MVVRSSRKIAPGIGVAAGEQQQLVLVGARVGEGHQRQPGQRPGQRRGERLELRIEEGGAALVGDIGDADHALLPPDPDQPIDVDVVALEYQLLLQAAVERDLVERGAALGIVQPIDDVQIAIDRIGNEPVRSLRVHRRRTERLPVAAARLAV
ncbi:MAG: hypothetical protein WDN44_00025 [Sphingomonas sp.]